MSAPDNLTDSAPRRLMRSMTLSTLGTGPSSIIASPLYCASHPHCVLQLNLLQLSSFLLDVALHLQRRMP